VPLDHSQSKIRVWKFAIDASVDYISLDLILLDTDGSQKYTALSYVWGEPQSLGCIFMNGAPLMITPSLYAFLSILLSNGEYTDRFFWADQICIDQTDTAERNHQVGLMSKVFSGAEEVFASLGDSPAFGVHLPYLYAKSFSHSEVISMADLLSRPYWSRLWIVQEILLAKTILFWLGGCQITQSFMKQFCLKFETNKEVFSGDAWYECRQWAAERGIILVEDKLKDRLLQFGQLVDNSHGYTMPVHDLVIGAEGRSDGSLSSVLARYSNKQCQDPRDKIFGLQALVLPHQRIQIDYSMSMSRLRRLVFKHHFFPDIRSVSEFHTGSALQGRFIRPLSAYHELKDLQGHQILFASDERYGSDNNVWMNWSRAMTWAYAITFVQRSWSLDAWTGRWYRIRVRATTPKQQLLAKHLADAANAYSDKMQEEFASHSRRMQCLKNQSQCSFCEQLSKEARRMIQEAVALHGFIREDNFLLHPEELCSEWSIRIECCQSVRPPKYTWRDLSAESVTDQGNTISDAEATEVYHIRH
jgi:hypothetical protein